MIVEFVTRADRDCREWAELLIDGECKLEAHDLSDCPEDATLSRDMSFFYEIGDLMQLAYDAGRRGEEIQFEYIERGEA